MKISVNDEVLFTLSEIQKQVIKNDIDENIFDADMKRRLQYILMQKYERCFARLKAEWESRLAQRGMDSLPTDPDKLAALIFSQPDYKSRSQREQQ